MTRNLSNISGRKFENRITEKSIKRDESFDELDVQDPGRLTTFKKPRANLSFVALQLNAKKFDGPERKEKQLAGKI